MLNNPYKYTRLIIHKFIIKKFILNKKQFRIGKLNLSPKFEKINYISEQKLIKFSFGQKNQNKFFFVIKRSPGGGFFSNLIYVLKSIEFAEKKNFIPIIDMENFKNKYSEQKNIRNIKNYWEVCFNKINNYKLNEVYNSKNVYFSNKNIRVSLNDYKRKKIKNLYTKYIKIKKEFLLESDNFIKQNFNNYKVAGFHLRGTDQKYSPGHALPFSLIKATRIIDYNLKALKYDKIFIVTDEKKYLDKLKLIYKKKIIFFNSFRANSPNDFNTANRKYHRNKLGIESLIEAIILSKCDKLIYINSNIPLFSIMISDKKIKKKIYNFGIKSKNIFIARFEFFLRVLLKDFLLYKLFK